MTPDARPVERKRSWRDEHLDCICGLANGRGGVLEIGRVGRGEVVGVADVLRLLDEIPRRVRSVLGIVVNVDIGRDCGRDYLRIVVPSHPTPVGFPRESRQPVDDAPRESRRQPDDSARNQPERQSQPENRQKTADRIIAILRENPHASRRGIVAALGDVTEGSVRYQLDKLKAAKRLRRVGPDRGGHWEVMEGVDALDPGQNPRSDTGAGNSQRTRAGQATQNPQATRKQPENHQKTARSYDQPPDSAPLAERILALLRRNPSASRRRIAATLGATESTVRYRLDRLRAAGKIARVGPDKGGHWKVLDGAAVPESDPRPARDPAETRA